jgi:ribosomal-protein-alanine N-acetyltransferase
VSDVYPDEVRTERLRLVHESTAEADLDEYYDSLAADSLAPAETEYAMVDGVQHVGEVCEFVADRDDWWGDAKGATYAIRPREGEPGAGALAGEATCWTDWDTQFGHFSVSLRKRFWGRGYSGERAAAFVELAFEHLDLDAVGTAHAVANENSRRAVETYVERLGGRREARLRNYGALDGEPVDVVRYTISREEYDASGVRPAVEFVDDRDDRRTSR